MPADHRRGAARGGRPQARGGEARRGRRGALTAPAGAAAARRLARPDVAAPTVAAAVTNLLGKFVEFMFFFARISQMFK